MKARPKTGDKREVQQPLKVDALPLEVRDTIRDLRAQQGYTWAEIEEKSREFVPWDTLPARTLEMFPGRRIPHSTLHRWYDLRVAQVQQEVMAQAERARQLAAVFAGRSFEDLPEAVQNALRDQIFALMEASDARSRAAAVKALTEFGWLLQQTRKNNIAEEKVKAEQRRVKVLEQQWEQKKKALDKATNDAASKLEKGKSVTKDDINRIRERILGLPAV